MFSPATPPPPPSSTIFFSPPKPTTHQHHHLKHNYQPTNITIHNFTNKLKHGSKIQTLTEFNHLFMTMVSSNQLDLAHKLYSTLPHHNLSPNTLTLSILVHCHCKRNQPFEAHKVLQHMIIKGPRNPNVKTFTQVINSFCKKGYLSYAYKVFDEMRELKCDPTINTYNCLLKGLCYVGRVEEAYELLVKLKTSEMGEGLRPDVYSFTAVMDGLCKVGRTDEALELLDEAVGMGLEPSIVSYNTVFNGYFKEGRPLEGFGLLERMKERGCVPDCVSYSTLLHGLLQWGEVRAAVKVCYEMMGLGFEVDERMMNTLLRLVCRRARKEMELLKDAYRLFDEMSTRGCVDFCGLELMVEAFCNGNEVDKAYVNLCEMVRLGLSPRMFTLSIVVRGLCVEGMIEEAMLILVLVCRGRSEVFEKVTFDVLINEMNRRGLVSHASCVYCVALKHGVIPLRKPRC